MAPASGKAPPATEKAASPPTANYERYGLTGSPFRDLSSDALADPEIYHVALAADDALATLKEEALTKENKAVVALVGRQGSGKTQRLRLAASEAQRRSAFVVYYDIPRRSSAIVPGLPQAMVGKVTMGGFTRLFSAPKWYRDINALATSKGPAYDPFQAGRAVADALNAQAPAFLLLNDLHNVPLGKETDMLVKFIEEVSNRLQPGTLVLFGCIPPYYNRICTLSPPLASRLNRTVNLVPFSSDEAGLLLAKRLLAKRLVEDLDPLYPFDREATDLIAQAAQGNPRRILELADLTLEQAVRQHATRLNGTFTRGALAAIAASPTSSVAAAPPAVPPEVDAPKVSGSA